VIGEWRRLHGEELHGWYTSPDITWVIKQGRMKWVMCVWHMRGRKEMVTGFRWR